MELTPRKKAIIAEIVKAHIETGEPIGSKILATRLQGAPSSATLRNEMSDLTEMGYLEQPHTSAGRQPTPKAYRLYVTELMGKSDLSSDRKEIIDSMLDTVRPDPESLASSAAEILSSLTGLPAISASAVDMDVRLKKVSLLPMGRSAAVVFVITDDGRSRSRLVRTSTPITQALITTFDNLVREKVCGRSVSALDVAYLQSIVVTSGLDALSLAPFLSCAFDMAGELKGARVSLGGAANLLSLCRADEDAKKIIDLLGRTDAVQSIFSGVSGPLGVVFGDDTAYSVLKPTGLIIASLGDSGELGRIAVLGPTRMAYDSIMPTAGYLAQRVGAIMSEVLKGLEE